MSYFEKVKELTQLNISDDLLISIVFEMSRFYDKKYTAEIKEIQKKHGIVLDSPTRKILRKKYYYGDYCHENTSFSISHFSTNKKDIESVFKDCFERLNTYDTNKIITSMKKRLEDLQNNVISDCHMTEWLSQYDTRRKNKLYSFLAIRLDQTLFAESGYNEELIINFIAKTYDSLENYRHLAIIIQGEIYNIKNECITWNLLYKAGIYAENFIQYKKKFPPFNATKQVTNLTRFLNERNINNASAIANNFYSNISTGYKYEDCYISDNQEYKILIYKKIELDSSHIPCPSCNTIKQSGNSYPEVFLKSWECKNPSCPDRSKSGRGKRFDEYGTYRYFKLVENNESNVIDSDLYQSFRRDIFSNKNDWVKFLIKEYTYNDEEIFMHNISVVNSYNRICINPNIDNMVVPADAVSSFEKLSIVIFYKKILSNVKLKTGRKTIKKDIDIINANSAIYLQSLKPGQIGTAITSPPYYNAREYSQWSTMMMYFVDMIINCKTVYNALADNSYYLYNIGDIVSEDNVYVVSNMSKRRVQLGFLSSMIFELAGYSLTGNIIWDKGEVQSKRNSTVNLFSGYVKCINCYEHILVFRKGPFERVSNSVEQITPVIKINSKGENTYKHTAPYPVELVELIKPYLNKQLYVLDPFLGSGTTLKWCKKNNQRGIGTELNKTYYELCKNNI